MTLRSRLFLLVAAVALPLIMLAAALIYDSYRRERIRAEERLQNQVQAEALLVDREFGRVQAVLETLAASAALSRDDLESFDQEMRAAGQSLRGEPLGLVARDGRFLDSTIWASSEPHPQRRAPDDLMEVFRRRQPFITDLHVGGNTGRPTISVVVPVAASGQAQVKYLLAAGVPPPVLSNLLSQQQQRGWVGGVLDRTYHVAARTVETERYLGTPALPRLREAASRQTTGVIRGRRVDGVPSSTVFARAPMTGFVVAESVPDYEFERPLRLALWRTLVSGAAISCAGLALAVSMARNLSKSIQGLAQPVQRAAAAGGSAVQSAPRVREVEIVAARLAGMAAERDAAAAALHELAVHLEQQVSERTEALAESEARLRAVFDAQFQYITLLDTTGRRIDMNRSALEFGAMAPGAVLGTLVWEAPWWRDHPDCVARIQAGVAQAARGEASRMELQASAADGGTSILDMSFRPVRDPKTGSVRLVIAEAHDITDLRALEIRLAQTSRLEALGQLAGGVAHDVNNVLQSISGAVALIGRRAEDVAAVRRLVGVVAEAIERGAAVTRRLLSFARRDVLSATPVDVVAMLENLREVLSHTLGSGIRVVTDVPTDLPPLLADRSQLETVLVNLATNARDAIGETGVLTFTAAEVRVSEADRIGDLLPGDYIRLTTRDDGTGMDAATLARAAEPFFTTKRAGQGTGLGLAMARGFAGQSGGALLIESAPGAGTQVTLWLPRADTNVAEDAPPAPAPAVDRHLLLVEDSDLLRGLLASALEAQGYAVTPAANAAEALALLEHMNDTPDLLITDLSMPGMNGLELIRIVQERLPQIPAILLTGFVSDAASPAVREALRGNRFALLHKPVSERHLAERVAALLEVGNAAEVSD